MTKRKPIISKQEIDTLYDAGDIEALRNLNTTYSKRANERLASLEKAGLETQSYNRAVDWLQSESSDLVQGNRFTRSKKLDADDLYNQLVQETDFLRSQTSTVAGEKRRREHLYNAMVESKVLDIGDSITKYEKKYYEEHFSKTESFEDFIKNHSDEFRSWFKKQWMRFIDEDVFKELVKYYKPTDLINAAADAILRGQNPQDLTNAFNDYMNGDADDTDISEIFETWARG